MRLERKQILKNLLDKYEQNILEQELYTQVLQRNIDKYKYLPDQEKMVKGLENLMLVANNTLSSLVPMKEALEQELKFEETYASSS